MDDTLPSDPLDGANCVGQAFFCSGEVARFKRAIDPLDAVAHHAAKVLVASLSFNVLSHALECIFMGSQGRHLQFMGEKEESRYKKGLINQARLSDLSQNCQGDCE